MLFFPRCLILIDIKIKHLLIGFSQQVKKNNGSFPLQALPPGSVVQNNETSSLLELNPYSFGCGPQDAIRMMHYLGFVSLVNVGNTTVSPNNDKISSAVTEGDPPILD